MILPMLIAATVAGQPAEGCRFVSQTGGDVIIFEDAASTGDAGDLLASFKLASHEPSDVFKAELRVRFKFRPRGGSWQWGGPLTCSGGRVISLPLESARKLVPAFRSAF